MMVMPLLTTPPVVEVVGADKGRTRDASFLFVLGEEYLFRLNEVRDMSFAVNTTAEVTRTSAVAGPPRNQGEV